METRRAYCRLVLLIGSWLYKLTSRYKRGNLRNIIQTNVSVALVDRLWVQSVLSRDLFPWHVHHWNARTNSEQSHASPCVFDNLNSVLEVR